MVVLGARSVMPQARMRVRVWVGQGIVRHAVVIGLPNVDVAQRRPGGPSVASACWLVSRPPVLISVPSQITSTASS